MVSVADIEEGLAIAEAIVSAIVRAAPAIEQGIVSSLPYVQAIAGLVGGSNATRAEIDAALESINAATDAFLRDLPPDDGTTTA